MPFMRYGDARKATLDVLNAVQNSSDKAFGRENVTKRAAESLGKWGEGHGGRLLMDAWDDLYRAGVVSYGLDMSNLGFGWRISSLMRGDREERRAPHRTQPRTPRRSIPSSRTTPSPSRTSARR